MHIIDVIDEISDNLGELTDREIAVIYNNMVTWGHLPTPIEPVGEGQFEPYDSGEGDDS